MQLLHFAQLADSPHCLMFKEFLKTDKDLHQKLTFFKRRKATQAKKKSNMKFNGAFLEEKY